MKRTFFLLSLLTVVAVGCKSADNATPSTDTTTTTSTTPATTTTTTGTADAPKADAATAASGDLSGTWDSTSPDGDGNMAFNADGTFTEHLEKDKMATDMAGTYKVEGTKITLTMTKLDLSSDDPSKKALVDQAKPMLKQALNKPADGTLAWKGKDEVVLTMGTSVNTMKRKS